MFLAACVSAAFSEQKIEEVIRKGLSVIPDSCTYRRMAEDLEAFHREHPDSWRECFSYVKDHYGYDRYPGNCHIIPNAAVIVLSLLYGDGDFSRTINICNMCGWDTDCNVGNAGMILGVLNGIEGIPVSWTAPVSDFLAGSSVLGCLNLRDIANDALYMASLAFRLDRKEPPFPAASASGERPPRFFFTLPRSTHSFRAEGAEAVLQNLPAENTFGGRCLQFRIPASPGKARIYRQTYYRPCDFRDDRYSPAFTPEVFPGQTVLFRVKTRQPAEIRPYALDLYSGNCLYGNPVAVRDWTTIQLSLPPSAACIGRVGLELEGGNDLMIDWLDYRGKADYVLDFSSAGEEFWTVFHKELGQTSHSKGIWECIDKKAYGSCADHGEIYTGSRDFTDYTITAHIRPELGRRHLLCARVQGNLRGYLAGFWDDELVILKNGHGLTRLASADFSWENGREYELQITVQGNLIELRVEDASPLQAQDTEAPYLSGCWGFSVRQGSRCRLDSFRVRELPAPILHK